MPSSRKPAVKSPDYRGLYTKLLSDMLCEQASKVDDWKVDTCAMVSEVLGFSGDLQTGLGRVHRTEKGDVFVTSGGLERRLEDMQHWQVADIASDIGCAVYSIGHPHGEMKREDRGNKEDD